MPLTPQRGRRAVVLAIAGAFVFGLAGTAVADDRHHGSHHHDAHCGHDYDDGHGYYDGGYGDHDDADSLYERRKATKLRAYRLMRLVDDNRDGYITYREARAWSFHRSFDYADVNRDGYVTERELIRFDLRYGLGDGYQATRPYRGGYYGHDDRYQRRRSYRNSRRNTYVRVRDHRGRTYYRRR